MHTLTTPVVEEFCKLCGWAYEVWLNHRELFDQNPRAAELKNSIAGDAFTRLSVISQEYALLQIIKLHDNAFTRDNVTLGIHYVLTCGNWSESVRAHLDALAIELNDFAKQLHNARNKSLSHNDLPTIVANLPLGAFANGADEAYFQALQRFVDTVHEQVIGGPWPFNDLVKNDVAALMATIKP